MCLLMSKKHQEFLVPSATAQHYFVCFVAILPESDGLSTCGRNGRLVFVACLIARWRVWCVSWVAIVCRRVGEFRRADALVPSVMSVLASRRAVDLN